MHRINVLITPRCVLVKPIAICRHEATQGPGYLQSFLDKHGVPYRVFAIDAGDTPPRCAAEFSGVVILGSNAGVNDGLAWIKREEALLKDALRLERPILGHCFGGQLLSKSLGGEVRRNSVPQIGWGKVLVTKFDEARQWLGDKRELDLFHWHFDTFEVPRGAKRMLFGYYCMNKGFALGPHLGLQSHLEVTAQSIRQWCAEDRQVLQQWQAQSSVQSEAQILHRLDEKVAVLHQVADHVYRQWLGGVSGALHAHLVRTQRPNGGAGWLEALK
ncbi:glutamine amidotransferase [Iodobacter fluviatilis]|uniref:Glutamine amidotransferase n=1 Tax=Iodobacter fluviatilis TaxID=537 RepID=A0A7G3G8P6_9NEIS|nr:glutamine amidotransferase [Iodobacter fluviatilis]